MSDIERRHESTQADGKSGELARARRRCQQGAWADAFDLLSRVDRHAPLDVEDLERLAWSAYLIGLDDEFFKALDRAYSACLKVGRTIRAARCAFWLGICHLLRGEIGRGSGWLSHAHRLMDREKAECAEHGYLLVPAAEQQLAAGDCDAAYASAARAAEIGGRFGEADLVACARHLQGRALVRQGRVAEGLALLDEAMVVVTTEDLSPAMTGLIYCSVIAACREVYAYSRAREWTAALAAWCAEQPQLVAFTRTCLVHRAEIMELNGAWAEAIEQAEGACERHSRETDWQPPAAAYYRLAELRRLRGEFAAAEAAYRKASRRGYEPQPGLALLRMAQGRVDAAVASIRRVAEAATEPLHRARLLPAYVEIMLAAGDIENARGAWRELEDVARNFDSGLLGAMVAHARGAIELADGDPRAALVSLRGAFKLWRQLEAPYEAARVRVLSGLACRTLADEESARLELDAARTVFDRLGAARDLARVDSILGSAPSDRPYGLTPRELQVLRLVCSGRTNRAIAAELLLSERTVDRHVSNIFNKLDVPSRVAATAFAYEHKLV